MYHFNTKFFMKFQEIKKSRFPKKCQYEKGYIRVVYIIII